MQRPQWIKVEARNLAGEGRSSALFEASLEAGWQSIGGGGANDTQRDLGGDHESRLPCSQNGRGKLPAGAGKCFADGKVYGMWDLKRTAANLWESYLGRSSV